MRFAYLFIYSAGLFAAFAAEYASAALYCHVIDCSMRFTILYFFAASRRQVDIDMPLMHRRELRLASFSLSDYFLMRWWKPLAVIFILIRVYFILSKRFSGPFMMYMPRAHYEFEALSRQPDDSHRCADIFRREKKSWWYYLLYFRMHHATATAAAMRYFMLREACASFWYYAVLCGAANILMCHFAYIHALLLSNNSIRAMRPMLITAKNITFHRHAISADAWDYRFVQMTRPTSSFDFIYHFFDAVMTILSIDYFRHFLMMTSISSASPVVRLFPASAYLRSQRSHAVNNALHTSSATIRTIFHMALLAPYSRYAAIYYAAARSRAMIELRAYRLIRARSAAERYDAAAILWRLRHAVLLMPPIRIERFRYFWWHWQLHANVVTPHALL